MSMFYLHLAYVTFRHLNWTNSHCRSCPPIPHPCLTSQVRWQNHPFRTICVYFCPCVSAVCSTEDMCPGTSSILWESLSNSHTVCLRSTVYLIKVELPCTIILLCPSFPFICCLCDDRCIPSIVSIWLSKFWSFIDLQFFIESYTMRYINIILFVLQFLLWPGTSCYIPNTITWKSTISGRGIITKILGPPMTFIESSATSWNTRTKFAIDFTNKRILVVAKGVNSLGIHNAKLKWISPVLAIISVIESTDSNFQASSHTTLSVLHCDG